MRRILVIGSTNVDNTISTQNFPRAGEELVGDFFYSNVGGKGLYQALAAHYLGADVRFFASLGKDENGEKILKFLRKEGMRGWVKRSEETTGYSSITLESSSGDSRVVSLPGANMDLKENDIKGIEQTMKECQILLIQLANPIPAVYQALQMAKKYCLTTVFNPSPINMELPDELLPYVDYMVLSSNELKAYTPKVRNGTNLDRAHHLLGKGAKNLIVTLGVEGSFYINAREFIQVKTTETPVVNSHIASDSYIGALVTGISKGLSIEKSMEFASRAASIAISRKGSTDSLPKLSDLAE